MTVGLSYAWWRPDRHGSGLGGGGVVHSRSGGVAAQVDRQEVERQITALEAQVKAAPAASRYDDLGALYLQQARITGDIRNYSQAENAATQALAIAPKDLDGRALLASVKYSTHDFVAALALAEGVVADDPRQVGALATVGDAQLELGDYAGAAAVYAKLAASNGDAAATTLRLSRLAYVQGRPEEARQLAAKAEDQARQTALGGPSLTQYEASRAQVELDTGHYADAVASFAAALEETPGSFVALAGLGRAKAAQGKRAEAIGLLEQAVAVQPDPGTLAVLGDLYTLAGDTRKAGTEYGTVQAIATLAALNQQVYNRPLAQFYADHDQQAADAVRLTETELSARKDVFGYDAYAWALYKAGRFADARPASDSALAQGTRDARLLYHSGMISKALGDRVRAKADLSAALAISPQFDPLQAPQARQALAAVSAKG